MPKYVRNVCVFTFCILHAIYCSMPVTYSIYACAHVRTYVYICTCIYMHHWGFSQMYTTCCSRASFGKHAEWVGGQHTMGTQGNGVGKDTVIVFIPPDIWGRGR